MLSSPFSCLKGAEKEEEGQITQTEEEPRIVFSIDEHFAVLGVKQRLFSLTIFIFFLLEEPLPFVEIGLKGGVDLSAS